MTTTQTPLGQFIIKRDGYLDDDYNEQLLALEATLAKKEALDQLKAKVAAQALEMAHSLVSKLVEATK